MRGDASVNEQMPWSLPVNIDRPMKPLCEEGVERIHAAATVILKDFAPPDIDGAIREKLADFVARRTIEGSPPTGV
ncbi:hypothetical protein ACG74X_13230 [Marivita sp. S0852]|uniref:hypothetical protein n=1 Tax=Marivita sp. S0852 TaxID=3373893 RepID=UPI0039824560